MGGCRCTFRDCTNNTVNSPGKHFFHFPYKDNERCKRWALNSEKILFLRLPWTQLRNKTVCEDHFTDHCFMNYKKERLVKTAVPTIYMAKDGLVHDIEVDESKLESLVYCFNEKGSDQKTIDLPDSQPQKRTIHVNLAVDEGPNADDEYNTIVLTDSNLIPDTLVESKTNPNAPNVLNDSKPVVLNRVCQKGGVKRFSVRNVQEKTSIKRPEYDEAEVTYTPNKRIKSEGVVVVGRTYGKSNATNSITLHDAHDSDSISPTTENGLNDPITVNILEKINHIEERDANKVDKSLYMQMMTEHSKQIEDLKKLLTDKLADKKDTQNSSASSSTDVKHIRVEKGPAMTKVQLFNGIRKYLNPTMVALLRMEMFGSSDREYRPDEKQLSKELYNLNQNVYDYMRDEWRFRLPPKADVEEWLKHPDDEETWDLC
ncbi:uncharacterized protein LOC129578588 [Sitodiplosis mosellana]|uniref:uncharacterized protein LOC129578588 n=1 Tax=Sitodiplosis mosellana TaxID=263140 RepID=UPI002444398D|nr:uncharacterized protein LOC129578588 [Sitodiplosis mosellana]XP_055323355.1 uncharacterized protein LOC129578588 [Sitodiplosis mosellana]XP_055323356.1 uncharacterized protein LOC129578588 [Sitodiplosis mosellana]